MPNTGQPIEIKLLGQRISLRSSHSEPELVREVVGLVTARIREAEERAPRATAPHQITLLALLDLAEEYLKAKRRTLEYQRNLDQRTDRLLNMIEEDLR